MQYAFGFAGGAGGIQDEQRVFRVHGFRRAVAVALCLFLCVVQIAAGLPVDVIAHVANDQHFFHHIGAVLEQGLIHIALEWNRLAAAATGIGGDHHFGAAVGNTTGQRIRGKAGKHHGMDGANAGAGQHGENGFRDHRHIDHHPVALADTLSLERIGELADMQVQSLVGDLSAWLAGFIRFPVQGDRIAIAGQVTVDAIAAGVQLAVIKPANMDIIRVEAGIANLLRLA